MMNMEDRNYQILKTIATGGTAVLYRAMQTSLDRQVVIKRLHSHLTSDPDFIRRFELEAKAAASLDHENIVRIIDFGSSNNGYYIVMEFIDGLSLKEIFENYGPLNENMVLLIAHEICMGLDHAHQRGITHRDIKPANIMITGEGLVKITDFGLVKLHHSQSQQTVSSTLLGTPLYMSPEQAIGNSIDGRSDLFSLGTICYELLTGVQPFIGDNYAAIIQNIINGNLEPPSRRVGGISRNGEEIVMKMLNREPQKRYRTALETARAIESHLGQERILKVREKICTLIKGDRDPETVHIKPSSKGTARIRRVLPIAATFMAIAAIAAFFITNPGRIEDITQRINRAISTDPLPPDSGIIMAGSDQITGAGTVLIPIQPQAGIIDSIPGVDIPATEPDSVPASPEEVEGGDDAAPVEVGADIETIPEEAAEEAVHIDGGTAVEAAETEDRIPVGYIDISVEPEAEILIDGLHKVHGSRIGPLELAAGSHRITCKREGYRDYRETVTIQRGELSRRRVLLQRMTGGLKFETLPGASVFIDGKFKGKTPLERNVLLPSGKHLIELRMMGYYDWKNDVFIPADETLVLKINLVHR